ncbi:chemotaxis protein CheB [soil metagenome]
MPSRHNRSPRDKKDAAAPVGSVAPAPAPGSASALLTDPPENAKALRVRDGANGEQVSPGDAIAKPVPESDREMSGEHSPRLPFTVVGIGASAGGLEACIALFKAMPNGVAEVGKPTTASVASMAFVIVQHLPPDRESLISEILQRHTRLRVVQVSDNQAIEPGTVYIIRPGNTLTMRDGRLHLTGLLTRPGHNRPVDDFFKTLAAEQQQRAVCIILSGMGSNGSQGAEEIKAVGGLCIAQDPDSALFPSMPRHLIQTSCADFILRPEDMPEVLCAYAAHDYAQGRPDTQTQQGRDRQWLNEILALLRTRTKREFSGYKRPTILRRVQRRMSLMSVSGLDEYAKRLRQSPTEVTALADDLLIHVTGFFRDAHAWEVLRERVIIPLVAAREQSSEVRCWVTACSSGEEAYSLAMLLVEESLRIGKSLNIKVFATDMSSGMLANARLGIFPGGIESEISPERLERFFLRDDGVYRVRQELRERVIFAPQDLLQDPPFSRLDIITCRNLLIYLEPEVQQRVLGLLHFGLRDGGTLFLGSSETVGNDNLFSAVDRAARIFTRLGPTRYGALEIPLTSGSAAALERQRSAPIAFQSQNLAVSGPAPRSTVAQMTMRILLERHTPPAVTVDRELRVVYYHGDTTPFLAQPRGEPTRDLLAMMRDTLRSAARSAVKAALESRLDDTRHTGWLLQESDPGADGKSFAKTERVTIYATPVDVRGQSDYFVLSFERHGLADDGLALPAPDDSLGLRRIRDELQATVDQLQASNEELKAAHEEVVSTNEEMQSINEELETSREEMQSLNEELTTANSQLQVKIEEHQAVSSDLYSLLSSTDIAVLFLDSTLRIRRFTPQVQDLVQVLSGDVGRPLSDLAWKFTDPVLLSDARAVLERLAPSERQVEVPGGRAYLRRITPYCTADNRISGVVIAFVEITARRDAETALRASEARFRAISAASAQAFYRMSPDWSEMRQMEGGDLLPSTQGPIKNWIEMVDPADRASMRAAVDSAVSRGAMFDLEHRVLRPDGKVGWVWSRAVPLRDAAGAITEWFGAATDITARREGVIALRASEGRMQHLLELMPAAVVAVDAEGRLSYFNRRAAELWGKTPAFGTPVAQLENPETTCHSPHESAVALLARAARTGESVRDLEAPLCRPDGTALVVSLNIDPLRDAAGTIIGALNVFEDITEKHHAAAAVSKAKTDAEHSNLVKDDFIATLSHELRTPLSVILLWSSMLKHPTKLDAKDLEEGLGAIRHSAEAQKELIDDLLDVGRIAAGKLRMEMREVSLLSVIEESVDTIMPTAEAKGVSLSVEWGSDIGIVRIDPSRIRQVAWNLLTNAMKFTPEGGRVTIGMRRVGHLVELVVTDTGKGISADFLPHIFDRFRQAETVSTRLKGGLGLGLAIVKQIVELHGGTVQAESAGEGKGASFIVRLPLPPIPARPEARAEAPRGVPGAGGGRGAPGASSAVDAPATGARPGAGGALPGDLRGVDLLLVEDDPATRSALVRALKRAGASVREAASVAEAWTHINAARPDVIVSDVGLPGETGHMLLERLRAAEAASGSGSIPALALTAFGSESDRRRSLDAGFQAHLTKPIDPETLIDAIAKHVALARGHRNKQAKGMSAEER